MYRVHTIHFQKLAWGMNTSAEIEDAVEQEDVEASLGGSLRVSIRISAGGRRNARCAGKGENNVCDVLGFWIFLQDPRDAQIGTYRRISHDILNVLGPLGGYAVHRHHYSFPNPPISPVSAM